ncbi:Het-C-domain-containing protein [Aaosphaeria arxii CBS 175.79]|uniref:Het-C-domain-containing protein n=1 Tax=Aaosphaeria arxii CBS 175.79 TaxID=1450172 RepID=A0A6A5Y0G3_9PLEO|nr:Het-C-domain-containing protein [Aaosphaeria arxii CBS 175.79]KAF2018716.1 Het-C-domain-containing protein [Aaosphaeria arxii CBS 175.79]
MAISAKYVLLVAIALLVLLPGKAEAFGAGNIASISKIEGKNWRHGDIEDMLEMVACLKGHKWNSMMIKRVYFGNWLRDYSQAVDTATLAKVQAETIRVLVWILSFMSFGYATAEFEVTAERLGVYRPEEHIDNPKDYADNKDAREFDPRLRPPVSDAELAVDPETGMKNYIANDRGGWATSTGYIRFSFARAIHFGRLYTSGSHGQRGKDEDLAEALRCLGQGLHCMEDFGAHTNYAELVLREIGYHNVFPHVGAATEINLHGKRVFPLVTGTFGGVDFFHSVLGEATDHFTQSEVDQMNTALADAVLPNTKRGPGGSGGNGNALSGLCDVLGKVPGTSDLVKEAQSLQAASDAQAAANSRGGPPGGYDDYNSSRASANTFAAPPGSEGGPPGPNMPGTNTDPATIIPKIYPILAFRDKVVRSISAIISKIPGLEKLIETITERVTLFVLSLLAPFIMPIIKAASTQLKQGSSLVVEAAAKHQFDVWNNPHSTDPTHSMLSKDHFSNILNEPSGQVAAEILKYVAPRIVYAWDNTDVPVDQVLNDVCSVFHHPALRNERNECHRNMFSAVKKWADGYRKHNLNDLLSSESVRAGKNHSGEHDHSHGAHGHGAAGVGSFGGGGGGGGHHSSHSSGGGHQQSSHGSSGGSGGGGLLSSLTSNLPGGLGSKLSPFLSSSGHRTREAGDNTGSSPGGSRPTTPGGSYYQQSQAPGNYGAQQPPPQDAWGGGQFHGGQGAEPSYTVPTAYQQGYENYGAGPGGYGQPPPQQGGYGQQQQQPPYQQQQQGGYDQQGSYGGGYNQGGYDQSQQGGGGRPWGQGGGNSGW